MTLHPTGKLENLKASIDKYIYTKLASNDSITVDWQGGSGQNLENVSEWIAPKMLNARREYLGMVTNSYDGENVEILLNINIFVKKQEDTNYNRLYELRDNVAKYFQLGQTITLKDMATSGYPYAGTFIVREIDTDSEVITQDAIADTVRQYNYSPILVVVMQNKTT